MDNDANSRTVQQKCSEILQIVGTFVYGFTIEQDQEQQGTDEYTLVVDESAFVEGTTLSIS